MAQLNTNFTGTPQSDPAQGKWSTSDGLSAVGIVGVTVNTLAGNDSIVARTSFNRPIYDDYSYSVGYGTGVSHSTVDAGSGKDTIYISGSGNVTANGYKGLTQDPCVFVPHRPERLESLLPNRSKVDSKPGSLKSTLGELFELSWHYLHVSRINPLWGLGFAFLILNFQALPSVANMRFMHGIPASFIEVTQPEYDNWKAGGLTGQRSCVPIGRYIEDKPPYADVDYCACLTNQAYADFPKERRAIVVAKVRPCLSCEWQPSGQWLANTCAWERRGTSMDSCRAMGGTYWHPNGHCGGAPCGLSGKPFSQDPHYHWECHF